VLFPGVPIAFDDAALTAIQAGETIVAGGDSRGRAAAASW